VGVSNVLDSLGCLPPQPASGLDDEHDEDDEDDDNKGRASGEAYYLTGLHRDADGFHYLDVWLMSREPGRHPD
jgi:hypothetical protein